MPVYSVALFAVAALFGLYAATRVFAGKLPPWPVAILHGAFAATGLVLLLYAAFLSGTPAPQPIVIAAALLLIAALGGFVLVSFHLRNQPVPKALAAIHALAAVGGFGTLAAATFGFI